MAHLTFKASLHRPSRLVVALLLAMAIACDRAPEADAPTVIELQPPSSETPPQPESETPPQPDEPSELLRRIIADERPVVTEKTGENISQWDGLGLLYLGLSDELLIALYGEPPSKSAERFQGADGLHVETWTYPAQGLTITMASDKAGAPKRVSAIQAKAPSKLTTSREIGIGHTLIYLGVKYGDYHDPDESTPELYVAGSIYGGVLFTLENDQVTGIFIGAAAE